MIQEADCIRLTRELLAIESPYFEEEAIMTFVADWLRREQLPAVIHRYEESQVTGFKGTNVLAILEGEEPGPTIHINGHLDTVQLCQGWTRDPYSGLLEGDRLYGLGALDMKSGCAASLLALKDFKESRLPFRGKILASFVSVEEGPYGLGTNALIDEGCLTGVDLSIVTEPSAGFAGYAFPTLGLGARGGLGLEITLQGRSAHAATPGLGLSAAVDAAKVILELERLQGRQDPLLGQGALCILAVHSDGGACSVPDTATIKLFRHLVRGENKTTVEEEIQGAIQRADIACQATLAFRPAPSPGSESFLPYVSDADHPLVASFARSVEAVCGQKPDIAYFESIGDFNYLGTRLGAPVVIFGAQGAGFHSADEYVKPATILNTAQVLVDFLKKTLAL